MLEPLVAAAVAPTTLRYFSRRGQQIWSVPHGRAAGYQWPQLSIQRGAMQQTLLDITRARIGAHNIHTGHHLSALTSDGDAAYADFNAGRRGGHRGRVTGSMIIAAAGTHSVARSLRCPNEGPPRWNGSLLWRGTAVVEPVFDGRTMVWAGHPEHKFVGYPIQDLPDGKQVFNFIAEYRTDDRQLVEREDWNQPEVLSDYIDRFADWRFDWLDVPALIRSSAAPTASP